MQNIRERYGADLSGMDAGELLALEALVIEQLAQLPQQQLTNASDDEDSSLSLADISRVAEENHRRFYNFQCRLALLLEGWFETVEARDATLADKGKRPSMNVKDFIAGRTGINSKAVGRSLRIAPATPTNR